VALHGAPAAAAAAEAEATSPTRGRRVVAAAALSPAEVAAQPLGKRTLIVRVLNVQSETVGALELRVRPQPYVVDQTFRFHQSEHEFLKTTIRMASVRWHASSALPHHLPAQHGGLTGAPPPTGPTVHGFSAAAVAGVAGGPAASAGGGAPPPVWVRSSDPNVVCGVHEQRSASQPLEVSIKFKCGSSPTVTRFLVLVYADVWMHTILETWELIVHALQRVDVHALMGQSSIAKAMLRGDGGNGGSGSRGLVQCFSSSPAELKLSPNAPFALTGGLTEVTLALRPHVAGRRQYVVHAVDLSRRALLASWLVCAVNRQPAITKAFELQVPAALGARKKVALSNPYAYDATFHFSTDKPHLLAFSAPSLSIPSQEAKYIGLHFSPLPSGGVSDGHTRVLVFVNNEEDKNEECMEITLKYVGA
jgi:nephrocystin-4